VTRLRGEAAPALITASAMTGCAEPAPEAARPEGAAGGAAPAAAESPTVKGRAPRAGYGRDASGAPGADIDSNRCGTRVVPVLRRGIGVFVQLTQEEVSRAY
jgi:hypothetical protein